MEERTGIFQWNVKWHGKALTSVPSAALTSGLLITLSTRLPEINPADVTGYALWPTLCFVVFYLLFAGCFTQMKRKDIALSAGVKHWHGAAPDSWFSHLALEVPGEGCANEWLEPVTGGVYP